MIDQYINDETKDMQIGKAGEHLVCFDLIKRGYVAYLSEQGLPYDVILDTGDKLYKIQVKTTREPSDITQRVKATKRYLFHVKRCGKKQNKEYKTNDVDIFALVGIDKMVIGYLPADKVKQTMFFLPEGDKPIRSVLEEKKKIKDLFQQGVSLKDVACITGKDKSYCIRVRDGKEENNFKRIYLSDYKLEDCL